MAKHLLLIEDNLSIREWLQTWLEMEGYILSVASDGQEALTLLRTSTPCIILLDLIMPSMNGYAFLEIFGQREPQTSIPIIVITADVEAVQRLADRNIPVLLKPFKFSTLLTTIQQSC
ncbi:MAG TPA: response regulator [Ktedonobacteraceae bacterium]|jgi:CheY-like chemotaxis protein|nr:response regulator [Ktedonobacteraceae bacterium]